MLHEVQLSNFKGFSKHTIPLSDVSILVGRNNAGKSTLIEALRLVAIVADRYKGLTYRDPPAWTDLGLINRGVSPSLRGMEFNFATAFHGLGDGPASIIAKFAGGERISVYVGDESLHAVITDRRGRPVGTKSQALQLDLPRVSIQPQVGPLARDEVILDPDYVRSAMSSYLASTHFRNQLRLFPSARREWAKLVEEAWPTIQIKELDDGRGLPGDAITLLVRDGNFTGEVGWMGHGLQMWLQMIWYLTLAKNDTTVILDEPDVYMHPDLQRRLLRMLRGRHPQTIVATHSVEIIAEARPREIVMVDRARARSRVATSVQAVQQIVDHLGGVQSLQLTRLWNAQRCVFVEGGDFRLLKLFHDRMEPESIHSLEEIPNMPIGGWGNWHHAVGASILLKNEAGKQIKTYCILDRDYHTEGQIAGRMKEAEERKVDLKIWARKEIENYLLVPEAIARVIEDTAAGGSHPTADQVAQKLEEIYRDLKDYVVDELAREILPEQRQGLPAANREARALVSVGWGDVNGRRSLVPGKMALRELSQWSKDRYGVTFGPDDVLHAMQANEISEEVAAVIRAIRSGVPFAES